ncbi:MAG: hypothetical protein QXM89_01215 [Candidatus Bathyarchaeia archaeon]
MFKFEKTQSIFEIGKVKVGGQPGELPTVLIWKHVLRGAGTIVNIFSQWSRIQWLAVNNG